MYVPRDVAAGMIIMHAMVRLIRGEDRDGVKQSDMMRKIKYW
jgi:hypothetical protein